MVSIHLAGAPHRLERARISLAGCGLRTTSSSLDDATALGVTLPDDGGLTLALWRPGAHPFAEEALFSAGVPALHAWWDARRAAVGPFIARGASCCPRCHRAPVLTPSPSGEDPALASWALGWACLEALTYLRHGTSELIGASWCWDLADPGLISTSWAWTPGCRTPCCRSR